MRLKEEIETLERARNQGIAYSVWLDSEIERCRYVCKLLRAKIDASIGPKPAPVTPRNELRWTVQGSSAYYNDTTVRLVFQLNLRAMIGAVSFSPGGDVIAFSDGHFVFVHNAMNGEFRTRLEFDVATREHQPRALAFSPDGRLVAVDGPGPAIYVFDIGSGRRAALLEGHTVIISALAWSGDGLMLVSGGYDGQVLAWDVSSWTLRRQLRNGALPVPGNVQPVMVVSAVFCAIGLVVAVADGSLWLWRGLDGDALQAHQDAAQPAKLAAYGTTLVEGLMDSSANVFECVETGGGGLRLARVLRGHTDMVLAAAVCRTDGLILTGSRDETIKAWRDEECLFTVQGHQNTVFGLAHHATERRFVSCGGDGFVNVWEYSIE